MTAVVTGAAGFLGSVLVDVLLGCGEDVIGIDRRPCPERPGLAALRADLLHARPDVRAALAEADAVFHLAGCPGVRDTRADAAVRRHRDNVLATAEVLAHVPTRTPLVVTSSSSVYGGSFGSPCAESDPLRPCGGYAESKAALEARCAERIAAGGRVVIARPFTLAGEGQRPDMAIARWIAGARAGRPLTIYGSTGRTRDVTDVRAAAGALVALAQCGATGTVNVGTGISHTLAEIVLAVARVLDTPVRIKIVPAAPEDVAGTLADVRVLRRLTGLELHTDLDDVVARAAAPAQALEAVS